MSKIIENMTGADIALDDIGITVTASSTYGLTNKPVDIIASSNDLITQLSSGNLKLQKSASPLIYYTVAEAIKILTLVPFTANLDSDGNQIISTPGLRHIDGRLSFHESSRPIGTATYFTGACDDRNDPTNIGDGHPFRFKHLIGDPDPVMYADLNIAENKTYIHEAYLMYKSCEFDIITAEIVPQVTPYTSGTATNFNIYGGYLVVPAAGDGVINIATSDMQLVYLPLDQSGLRSPAYWNATRNFVTHQFENIVAAPAGDGAYNMFTTEVILQKFLNNIPLLGTSSSPFMLQTSDSHELGENMRLKITGKTNVLTTVDHDWEFSFLLTLHRARSA